MTLGLKDLYYAVCTEADGALFKYHKEYNPHIFRQKQAGTPAATENMDDIDIALGGF